MTEIAQTGLSTEPDEPTRRGLLRRAAAVSGAAVSGGLVAGLVGTPPARAATGDKVTAGDQTNAENSTVLFLDGVTSGYPRGGIVATDTAFGSLSNQEYGLAAVAGIALNPNTSGLNAGVAGIGSNIGVYGAGTDGIYGIGSVNGVFGTGVQGVLGTGSTTGILGVGPSGAATVGVEGRGGDKGVYGSGDNQGVHGTGPVGVIGVGTTGGVGVSAVCPTGHGLTVDGKVAFSTSGLASIPKHDVSVTVHHTGVTAKSLVLATLQTADGSIAVAHAVPTTGRFTITLTGHATKTLHVAWFVIN